MADSDSLASPYLPKVKMASPASATSKPHVTPKVPFRRLADAYYPKARPAKPSVQTSTFGSESSNIYTTESADPITFEVIVPKVVKTHCPPPIGGEDANVYSFRLSKSQLTSTSGFAKHYFKERAANPTERLGIQSWSLAPVQVYIAWVQHRLPILMQNGSTLQKWGDEDLSIYRLVDLWNLGMHMDDRFFRDAVIDAVQRRMEVLKIEGELPGYWAVDNAYFFLRCESCGFIGYEEHYKLRKRPRARGTLHMLLEDIFARVPEDEREEKWNAVVLSGPAALRDGISKRQIELQTRAMKGDGKRVRFVGKMCEFHEHLEGEECSKWAGEKKSIKKFGSLAQELEDEESGGVQIDVDGSKRNDSVAFDI